jgi:hypothetical protein
LADQVEKALPGNITRLDDANAQIVILAEWLMDTTR